MKRRSFIASVGAFFAGLFLPNKGEARTLGSLNTDSVVGYQPRAYDPNTLIVFKNSYDLWVKESGYEYADRMAISFGPAFIQDVFDRLDVPISAEKGSIFMICDSKAHWNPDIEQIRDGKLRSVHEILAEEEKLRQDLVEQLVADIKQQMLLASSENLLVGGRPPSHFVPLRLLITPTIFNSALEPRRGVVLQFSIRYPLTP